MGPPSGGGGETLLGSWGLRPGVTADGEIWVGPPSPGEGARRGLAQRAPRLEATAALSRLRLFGEGAGWAWHGWGCGLRPQGGP